MKALTRNGFAVMLVTQLNEIKANGIDLSNITSANNQKSDDGLNIYIKGNYEGAMNFDNISSLHDYIYNNGWTKPVSEEV